MNPELLNIYKETAGKVKLYTEKSDDNIDYMFGLTYKARFDETTILIVKEYHKTKEQFP